jgi:predicted dehydrogenase
MKESPNQPPVRIALVGAGVFARDAHLPSLLRLPEHFEIAAVFSRSLAAAEALAQSIPYPVPTYTNLGALLAQPDIQAVDLMLPVAVMPAVLPQIWVAGKPVLSEKPIAPNVATGRSLIEQHAKGRHPLWLVGENWRYEAAFLQAAEIVASGEIGTPLTCHWAVFSPITPDSKYYHSEWRRDTSFRGGYVTDGGVHHVAALRMILGEVTEVTATFTQHRADLPPGDTLAATLRFANGALGTYLATYATRAPWSPHLFIAGTQGSLRVQRREIEVTSHGTTRQIQCSGFDGVEKQLAALANTLRTGAAHLCTPQEALADLAVIEAMLDSAACHTAMRIG